MNPIGAQIDEKMRGQHSMLQVINTYKALVEAVIPWTPKLAAEYGEIQYFGAIESLTYEYVIASLYQIGGVGLVGATAKLLDTVATELIMHRSSQVFGSFTGQVTFGDLDLEERISVLYLLKQQELTFLNQMDNADKFIINTLLQMTMMGYYSEWFGYGSTRLNPPGERVMEFQPISWKQVGYPGPSLRREVTAEE